MQVQSQPDWGYPQLDMSYLAPLLFWLTLTGNFARVDLPNEGFSVNRIKRLSGATTAFGFD